MSFTLDAIRNYAIPSSLSLDQTRRNAPNLRDLSRRSCWRPSPRTSTKAHVTRSICRLPSLRTNFDEQDELRRRSRGIVRCEMPPKGRGSSDPSPGHDEQPHGGERKHCRRDQPHSDHQDEPQHPKSCNNKRAEGGAQSDLKPPGSEWHDVFQGELREWKGVRGVQCEEDEQQYREYTPRHGGGGGVRGGEEGRGCGAAMKESDKGYVINVSKELMGLFCYIEKRKRSMIKELAHTLRQVRLGLRSFVRICSPAVQATQNAHDMHNIHTTCTTICTRYVRKLD